MARIAIDCRKIADFGIGTWVRSLLAGLEEIDSPHEFLLLAPSGLAGMLPTDVRFSHVPADSPHYSFRELARIGRQAEQAGADLLHVPHYVVPATRLPVVTTIHDLIHLRLPADRMPFAAKVYARAMFRRAIRLSRRILVPTEAVADEIVERWPRAIRPRVTGCGIDPLLEHASSGESIPGLQDGGYFLAVANDKPHKNVARLVEAFEMVRRDLPEIALVLVGGDFRRFDGDRIVHPGYIGTETLRTLYENALAVVQPSLMEGFGLPVLEAMWFGRPVAVSAIPSLVEVVGDAGLRFDPHSVQSIADALTELATSEDLRTRLAAAASERASAFTRSHQAATVSEAWDEVLSATAGRAKSRPR